MEKKPEGTFLKHRAHDGTLVKMYLPSDATSDEQIDAFFRFLLAVGYSPVSINSSMSDRLQEYENFYQDEPKISVDDLDF